MNERKKKIASLVLSASLLISATGCSKNSIKQTQKEDGSISYTGKISNSRIENLYIVEIINPLNERVLYLTDSSGWSNANSYLIGTGNFAGDSDVFVTKDNDGIIVSDFGEVKNMLEFKQFISLGECGIKEEYSAEEIMYIFEKVKENYDEIIENNNIKKLELK